MSPKKPLCSLTKVVEANKPAVLEMMEAFYAIDNYPFDAEKAERSLAEFMHHPEYGSIWLVQANDLTVGYAILCIGFTFEFGGRDAFIDELFIKEEHRGMGYGNCAMDLMENQALALGLVALHLEVELHNERGMTLYKKKGFHGKKSTLLSKVLSR